LNHAIKVILRSILNMPPTKSFKDLCAMTRIPETAMRKIIQRALKIGTMKEVSPDVFEMTETGMYITKNVLTGGSGKEAGMWTCIKCNTINNILNGNKCIKCDYSIQDNLASEALKKERKKLEYPKVTQRETMIFLLGQMTGLAMNVAPPKNMSMIQELEFRKSVTGMFASLTIELKNTFSTIADDEFAEIMVQLDAVKTLPIMNDIIKKLKKRF